MTKKCILLLIPLTVSSSLLSMEKQTLPLSTPESRVAVIENNNNIHSPLDQSGFTIPMPTTRGLGFFRSTKDFIWNSEDNIFAELESKTLDLKNSSYHHKLDAAIGAYSDDKNREKLVGMLALCRQEPYIGRIQIKDVMVRKAHEFLVSENRIQQEEFKNIIENKDKEFIQKQNLLLEALQNSLHTQLEEMDKQLDDHKKEQKIIVREQSEKIQTLKKALLQLHHLNKTVTLDGYCSDNDEEFDEYEQYKNKVIAKTESNVKEFYSDKHLLKKIKVDVSISETKAITNKMLKVLYEINTELQNVDLS